MWTLPAALAALLLLGTPPASESARELAAASGVQAGLCVHLGVTDGRLTAELGRSGKFLVHGLAPDPAAVEAARQHIREAGLCGRVSVEQGSFAKLPYAEDLANLVVVSAAAGDVNTEEVARVLAPNGAACFEGSSPAVKGLKPLKTAGGWSCFTKPLPAGSGQWTHQNHDPSGNRVSEDILAGPPQRLRWIAGVEWAMPDYAAKAMVVGGGRVYYVINESPVDKGSWPCLSVRDAFSGVLLWKRAGSPNPLTMIAAGDRLYLDSGGKLVAVDGASGRELMAYNQAPRPAWALLAGDRLLVACQNGSELRCLDPASGAVRWKAAGRSFEPGGGLANAAVQDQELLFVERRKGAIGCLDLATGAEKWHREAAADLGGEKNALLAACQGEVLVLSTGKGIAAFSTRDGRHLWSHSYEVLGSPTRRKAKCFRDGFFIAGLYWTHVGDLDPAQPEKYKYERGRKFSWQGLDPATGKVKKVFPYPEGVSVGASCFPDQATVRWFMGGYSDFMETATGKYQPRAAGLHSSCGIGVRAAYGLIYNSALYMPGRFLQGDMAVEGGSDEQPPLPDDPARLEKGPAFGSSVANPQSAIRNGEDWPLYRHDGLRTSRTPAVVPAELVELWAADVGAGPSAPTVAGGRVFVASAEEHRVSAFDAAGGNPLWSFAAGGRVKVPPTCDRGLCLFGSGDGYVYCLDAASGKLAWRFRAARTARRIVARERVESAWPVEEGVLVRDGLAAFTAGRHGEVDGGCDLYVLDAAAGKLSWHQRVAGGYPPLLATDGKTLAPSPGSRYELKTAGKAARLEVPDSAYDRRVIDPSHVIGKTATLPIRLRALIRAGAVVFAAGRPADGAAGAPSILWQRPRKEAAVADVPEFHPQDGASPRPADWRLWAFSADDGRKLAEMPLPSRPAWDGMAAAGGRLYITTEDGKLRCLGKK